MRSGRRGITTSPFWLSGEIWNWLGEEMTTLVLQERPVSAGYGLASFLPAAPRGPTAKLSQRVPRPAQGRVLQTNKPQAAATRPPTVLNEEILHCVLVVEA